jgi:hypothetical protein
VIATHDDGAPDAGRDLGGADALGLVLMFPVMLGLAVLILFLGRQVDTRSQIQAAADAAAQSAVLQRGPDAARGAAARAADANADRLVGGVDRPQPRSGAAVTRRTSGGSGPGSIIDRGSAIVATLTLTFVLMAGAFIWLSRTVDRSLHDRSQATSVAFQAARAGAQAVDLEASNADTIVLDATRAAAAARVTATLLLTANGDSGEVGLVRVDGPRVTVTVTITTTGRRAVGTSSATAHIGFDAPDQ